MKTKYKSCKGRPIIDEQTVVIATYDRSGNKYFKAVAKGRTDKKTLQRF